MTANNDMLWGAPNFEGFKLLEDLKAFQPYHDGPPLRGDARPTRDYPAGTRWTEITDFEVWDGEKWVVADHTSPISKHD